MLDLLVLVLASVLLNVNSLGKAHPDQSDVILQSKHLTAIVEDDGALPAI